MGLINLEQDESTPGFIVSSSELFTMIGFVLLSWRNEDRDSVPGLKDHDDDDTVEEIIDTNTHNIQTIVENQRRMQRLTTSQHQSLESLVYKVLGIIITLFVAMMGLLGTILAISL